MIMKISRFKSVDRYDLFLVLLYNGKCLTPLPITLKGPS